MKKLIITIFLLLIGISGLLFFKNYNLQKGIAKANVEFENYIPAKILNWGTVESVSITPLIDWHAVSDSFKTEAGVSYLIKTDKHTILFDLGYNPEQIEPSPLQQNMAKLGITLVEIDMIVISHNHFDHVGGKKWMDANTFSLGNVQSELGRKTIYTPIDMTYPGQHPITTQIPQMLDSGIATIGTIPAELIIGKIDEQALAIHIKGKGILLVVGCSHQTIPKIIKRTKDLFSEPIYAIVGGLHFPIPEGRLKLVGGLIDAQKIGSGNGPFDQMTQEDVDANIKLLKDLGIKLIGVGGHDSSDEVIQQFKKEFGDAYRYVKVGKRIDI
ncbi:MAG TPA: MBL fold metallo-hydrolase [Niabella sp.]|nr:MBL fold metallo-hydrolase [Niabella sp.]HOZ97834.1 MBL fold metallo-hydrolase [Niabella sp.]HQW15673.1 MBL fold metallo-hydrolase [Niabella sp.]HQX20810.1 MBL fold metallo-hydrolase [Niabella sp.]HQX41395.1 MBL fold metallo-hydrolase [Niabella sp.]